MGLLLILGLAALAYLYETQPAAQGGERGETRIHSDSNVRGADDSHNQPRQRNSGNHRTGGVKRGAGGKFQKADKTATAATPPATKPDDKPASEEATAQ